MDEGVVIGDDFNHKNHCQWRDEDVNPPEYTGTRIVLHTTGTLPLAKNVPTQATTVVGPS